MQLPRAVARAMSRLDIEGRREECAASVVATSDCPLPEFTELRDDGSVAFQRVQKTVALARWRTTERRGGHALQPGRSNCATAAEVMFAERWETVVGSTGTGPSCLLQDECLR